MISSYIKNNSYSRQHFSLVKLMLNSMYGYRNSNMNEGNSNDMVYLHPVSSYIKFLDNPWEKIICTDPILISSDITDCLISYESEYDRNYRYEYDRYQNNNYDDLVSDYYVMEHSYDCRCDMTFTSDALCIHINTFYNLVFNEIHCKTTNGLFYDAKGVYVTLDKSRKGG